MASSSISVYENAPIQRASMARRIDQMRTSFVPSIKSISHYGRNCQQARLKKKVAETFKKASGDGFGCRRRFVLQVLKLRVPALSENFAPVEEIEDAVPVKCVEGEIPAGFPKGIFVRNGEALAPILLLV